MFTTTTSNVTDSHNNNLYNDSGKIEENIEQSATALTELTIQDTQNEASDDKLSCKNSTTRATGAVVEPHEVEGVRYGKCKWFNVAKGWGFITPNDGGQEVFVHQSVIQMSGFRSLGEKEDVEFECHLTKRGLEAIRVSGRQGTDCHGSTFRPRIKNRHRRVRCYNCGEFANHIASKCHLEPQPKRCHLCKQGDHLFANCPTKKANPTLRHSKSNIAIKDSNTQEGTLNETS